MIKHESVLTNECIEGLNIKPSGIYVDVTFGAGGHAKEIIEKLDSKGRLIAFDQDLDVASPLWDDTRCLFIRSNFRYLTNYLDYYQIGKVDGILADLGVSSHQFDVAERGFSFRFDGDIDMRMNTKSQFTGKELLNTYSRGELQRIFQEWGEVRNAKTLAEVIIKERGHRPFELIGDFVDRIESCIRGNRARYLSQVFQAIRMEVNEEIGVLTELLLAAVDRLKKGGRLVVISFHSIEDRAVKRVMKSGNAEGKMIKDDYGHPLTPFKEISKKVITPGEEELKRNPRSRSAKLRIAERL